MINKFKSIKYILLSLLVITAVSCSRVGSDAKKAAKLTNKSIEKTNQMKLKNAEKLYNKSQEIQQKYETHKKRDKFYKVYQEHRDKGKAIPRPEVE